MADDGNHDALLAEFQAITGESEERSRFYLESSNWQLEVAISAFYENDDGPPPAEVVEAPPGSSITAADDSSSEEEGQAFYAGGSSTSGQQILGPAKKKGADFVSEMFKKARESGATEAHQEDGGPSTSARSRAFQGTAFRLGTDEEEPSQRIAGAPKPPEPREFTLKMWSNGFSIDDGELRLYNDPANRQFLESVMKGRIPPELVKEARGGEVHVNMEDHKTEEFVKAKAKRVPFQGTGHMLGSIAPSVNTESGAAAGGQSAAPSTTPEDNATAEQKAKAKFAPDAAAPTTTVQIRLNDGSRLIVQMNRSRTVGDLREYVRIARPSLRNAQFSLNASFPPKELTDDVATLESEGLLNAALMLRLK